MNKLIYMHYPKSRTTGAAFCLEEDVVLIRDEGAAVCLCGREKKPRPRYCHCEAARRLADPYSF